ncbi:MAG TPA: RNA polymerase sigma factor [Chthonomonadaceae bacterium]|nr:RNA polymerase sigma factor [Chthonomonadaceae bacterium]
MRHIPGSATVAEREHQGRTDHCRREEGARAEICDTTGEPLFRAGEYVEPGEYVEIEIGRSVTLTSPDFLPARLDGHVACYRRVRRSQGETGEQKLVQRQAEFQEMTAQIRLRLYHFALRAMGNTQDAEDVTQETLARAWSHFEAFDNGRSFEGWIFQIARNLMIDMNRRRRRRQEISLDAPAASMDGNADVCCAEISDSRGDPQGLLMDKQISPELQSALRSLPPYYQASLLLLVQQRSYVEIARMFDCPVGTVRSRVHRARVLLQRRLKESAPYA